MSGRDERFVGRREVLATMGAAALSPALGHQLDRFPGSGADGPGEAAGESESGGSSGAGATLRVRAYPRIEHAADRWSGWSMATMDAHGAVGDALAAVASYAETEREALGSVDWQLDTGAGVSLQGGTDATTLLDRFRETIRDRDVGDENACHLLLWSEPVNYEVGYGMALSDVAADDDGGYALVNVGATERWDDRTVTRNMAIHEALHTFLSDEVTETVVDGGCDHALGSVRHVGDGVAEVSPMATSYAGRDRPGGETFFSGSGCGDRDEFYRHDGVDGVGTWRHTTDLSEGTLEAVSRYVEQNLAGT